MMLATVLASIVGFYLLCCVVWCLDDELTRYGMLNDPKISESEKQEWLALMDEIRVFHTGSVGLSVKRFVLHPWMYHVIWPRWVELYDKYHHID